MLPFKCADRVGCENFVRYGLTKLPDLKCNRAQRVIRGLKEGCEYSRFEFPQPGSLVVSLPLPEASSHRFSTAGNSSLAYNPAMKCS